MTCCRFLLIVVPVIQYHANVICLSFIRRILVISVKSYYRVIMYINCLMVDIIVSSN